MQMDLCDVCVCVCSVNVCGERALRFEGKQIKVGCFFRFFFFFESRKSLKEKLRIENEN